jgi:hypothetical protein
MARHPVTPRAGSGVVIRIADPEWGALWQLMLSRYPGWEWATFVRFGWRATADGLVLALAALDAPTTGDLDERVGNVAIQEQYTLRMALAAERHDLAIGVVHSHPQNCVPRPSPIDDDMDTYYADYFSGFAPGRPYVSLIVAKSAGVMTLSGRVFWQGEWLEIETFATPAPTTVWTQRGPIPLPPPRTRTARLNSAMGEEAAALLRRASVAVIGAGGTGSPAIEVLARAGVGNLVIVDPESIEDSNLERVHGSYPRHAENGTAKVLVAKEHVHAIDPDCRVTAIIGRLPQQSVMDAVVRCDVVLGCTDKQHSRLALSELAFRYLVPSVDCGVSLEGADGVLTGQIAQFVRFLPFDACALCQKMIAPVRLAQELMSDDERQQRRRAAVAAQARGDDPDPYWLDEPQLNTIGYLTTAVGALAAGYAIGWITGRFAPPFARLQVNFGAPLWDVTDQVAKPEETCTCRKLRGWADQGAAYALISPPKDWPEPRIV